MVRWLAGLLVLILVGFGSLFVVAGRSAPPQLTISKPDRFVGQASSIDLTAEAPNARFTALTIAVEQNGIAIPLFSLAGTASPGLTQLDRNRVRIVRPLGKQSVPELQQGAARLVVAATRRSFLNLRALTSTTTKDVQVRLEPPRITVVSTHHHVNHGGSEMVVYRVTPSHADSGVRVEDIEYPGFPASGAGVTADRDRGAGTPAQRDREVGAPGVSNDPALKVAFFALLYDQDLNSRITVFARDEAGNEAQASFVDHVFKNRFKRSKIELDAKFLNRVVPEILAHSPELKIAPASGDPLPAFLALNGELRRIGADEIAGFSKRTSMAKLWDGPFVRLGNSQVEASFADHRTYFYKGKEVDQQMHLGFDLAVTANVPVVAANNGNVLNARWLGIYGNSVILDHGLGVQSLYGHLSSLDVKVGESVTRGQVIGRSGMTGLAVGDHLHFTMLVGGRMVNPVEWWDPHWISDRVERKLREAR